MNSSSCTSLTDILRQEARTTYAITEKLFHHVNDTELMWTPSAGENWMTVGQLMMHCAQFGCGLAVRGFIRGEWDQPEPMTVSGPETNIHIPPAAMMPAVKSVAEALDRLAADSRLTLACLDDIEDSRLLSGTIPAPWGGPDLCLFQHLYRMIAHLSQHKGQLFYYLKLMGKNVSTEDLWGK